MANVRTIISGNTLGTLKPIDISAGAPGLGTIIVTWVMKRAQPVPTGEVDENGVPVTRPPTVEEGFAQLLEPTYANWARQALEEHEAEQRAAVVLPESPSGDLSVSIEPTP